MCLLYLDGLAFPDEELLKVTLTSSVTSEVAGWSAPSVKTLPDKEFSISGGFTVAPQLIYGRSFD